jgi:hypothetical protein
LGGGTQTWQRCGDNTDYEKQERLTHFDLTSQHCFERNPGDDPLRTHETARITFRVRSCNFVDRFFFFAKRHLRTCLRQNACF